MSQLGYIPPHNTPKINDNFLRRSRNKHQELLTQGRYIEPKLFSGFQHQRIKLTTVKKQLYNPKLPPIRRIERDEVSCHLSDIHSHYTTSSIEEQSQNFDPKTEESLIASSILSWNNTDKILPSINNSSIEFGVRLQSDKSQKDSHSSQIKFHRNPSLFSMSPSIPVTKPIKSSYRNYGNNTLNQSSRFHLNTKNSSKSTGNIFRASNMYVDKSTNPWNLVINTNSLKSIRV